MNPPKKELSKVLTQNDIANKFRSTKEATSDSRPEVFSEMEISTGINVNDEQIAKANQGTAGDRIKALVKPTKEQIELETAQAAMIEQQAKEEIKVKFKENENNLNKLQKDIDTLKKDDSNYTTIPLELFPKDTADFVPKTSGQLEALRNPRRLKPEVQAKIQELEAQKYGIAIDDNSRLGLGDLIEERQKLYDKYSWKGADRNTSFTTNPFAWAKEGIENVTANLVNHFSSPVEQMSETEKAKFNTLNQRINTIAKPIVSEKMKIVEQKLNNLDIEEWAQAEITPGVQLGDVKITGTWYDKGNELKKIRVAKDLLEEAAREGKAYLEDQGAFDVLNEAVAEVLTFNDVKNTVRSITYIAPAIDKYNAGEKLTDAEQYMIESLGVANEITYDVADKQSFGYKTVRGLQYSGEFMRDLALGNALVKGAKAGVNTGAKQVAKTTAAKTLSRTGSRALANTAAGTVKVGGAGVELGLQTLAMPFSYAKTSAENYIGQTITEYDSNGNPVVYVRDKAYDKFKDQFSKLKTIYGARRQELLAKDDLTSAEAEELETIEYDLGIKTGLFQESLDEQLEKLKPMSWLEATGKGVGTTFTENLAERYTRDILGAAGKGLNRIKPISYVTAKGQALAGKLANTKLGRYYNNFVRTRNQVAEGVFGKGTLGGFPEEFAEEWAVAPLNALVNQDVNEVTQMFSLDTNLEIAAQTLIMTTGLGGGFNTYNKIRGKLGNKQIQQAETLRKSARSTINNLLQANEDKDVHEVVDLMTASNGFNIADAQMKIAELKAKNKFEEAQVLEKAMFQNVVSTAFATGSQNELGSALEKLSQNEKLSDETKINAVKAKQNLDTLKPIYERYKANPNVGEIVNLGFEKILNKQAIDDVSAQMVSMRPEVEQELSTMNVGDYSLEDLLDSQFENTLAEETDKQAYKKAVTEFNNTNSPVIEAYMNLQYGKDTLIQNTPKVMRAFNEAVRPSAKTINSNNFRKAIGQEIAAIQSNEIENTNAEFNFNNELQLDDALVNNIIDKLATTWTGKEADGKLSKQDIETIRNQFLGISMQQNDINQLESLERINELYDNTGQSENQAVDIILNPSAEFESATEDSLIEEEPYEPSVIEEAATEFKDFTSNMEDGLAAASDPDAIQFDSASEDTLFDDFRFQPAPIDNLSEGQRDMLRGKFRKLYDAVETTNNRKPAFEDIIGYMLNYDSKENVERQFNIYKNGWILNNLGEVNFDNIYNTVFDPFKEVRDSFMEFSKGLLGESVIQEPTVETVAANTTQQENQIEQDQAITTSYTEENIPIKAIGGKRINHAENKLAFSAIRYNEVEALDGTWQRITAMDGRLNFDNENSLIDFRDLLNPDLYNKGSQVSVAMAPEHLWDRVKITVGRAADGSPVLKSFSEFLAEKEAANPDYRNTQDFRNVVPIITYSRDGKPLSFIHDTNWYNIYNVADPTNFDGSVDPKNISKAHWDLIQEGKDNVSNLRNEILNGNLNTLRITEKKEGAFYTVANRTDAEGNLLPLMSINEANPQAVVAVQFNQGRLEVGNGVSFENDNRKLINRRQIQEDGSAGNTWNVRRIGVDPQDGKETWRAFQVVRYVSEQQLETVRWAWAAQARVSQDFDAKGKNIMEEIYNKTVRGTKYDLTPEQAQKIIDDVKNITGYNLAKWKDAGAFFKLYFQPRTNDKISTYGYALYSNKADAFAQHTSNEGLGRNATVVHIENAIVSSTNKNYVEYLKDTLQTDVKSFNVGTEDKPVFATSIQPVILFDYDTNQEQEDMITPPTQLERRNQIIQEVIEEQGLTNPTEVINQFNELKNSLGFNFNNFSAQPTPLISTEYLQNIFNITPGLSISQEGHIVDFIYNYISSAIDVKYKAKVNKAKLLEDLKNSYNEIVGPARSQVEQFKSKLQKMDTSNTEVANTLIEADKILTILDQIKNNWDRTAMQKSFEAQGIPYNGELGILEKAMEEVNKTSDIKEEAITDDEDQDEEDTSMRTKSFEDNASLTESGKQKTTYRLRRFMAGIQRRNPDGTVKKGFLGLPEFVGFNEVYDTLYQLLGTGVYIQSDYEAMKAKILEMTDTQPWVSEFVEKLDNADEQLKKEFVYNYRKHAIAMKFAMYSSGNSGTKLKVYDTNANEISRVIIDTWKNNLITSSLVQVQDGEYAINKEVAQELLEQYNTWGDNKAGIPQAEVKAWLANFGIELNEGYWNELVTEGFKYGKKTIPYKNIFAENNTPIGLLHNYLKRIVNQADTSFEDNEKNHPYGDMGGVLKALAKGQSRYSAKTLSKSFRDAGKNISGITAPTYVTNRIDDLKRAALDENNRKLINDLQSLSISQDSLLLDLLLTEPDFASKFEANYLGLTAFKQYGKKASSFAGITDLNSLDHDVTKLTMFQDTQQGTIKKNINGFSMRMGRMFLPTMSDKTQMLMLATGVFNFMEDSVDAFKTNTDGQTAFTDDLRELLYSKLVLPELKRILNFHNNVGETNIAGYDKGAQIFNFIPALNNIKDENGDRMIKHLAVAENITLQKVEEMFKPAIMDVVENVVHAVAQEKMNLWETFVERDSEGKVSTIQFFDSKYLSKGKGTLNDKFNVAVYDFVLNSMLTNADMFTVIAGDPAMYSQDKNFKKSPIPFDANDDNFFFEVAEKNGINIGKRLALLIAPGSTLADSENQEYRQVFLQDSVDITSNASYLIKLFHGQKALDTKLEGSGFTVVKALELYPSSNDLAKKLIRQQLSNTFPDLADYFDIESTDAQEYTTVGEHIYILRNQGRLSQEQYNTINDKISKNEILTKEELSIVLQPIKPVHTGQVIDKDQDVARVVYIKSSSWPLLPQVTAGTNLDNLRVKLEEMEREGGMPVRASYQTANKVGAMKGAIDPFNPESLKLAEQASLVLSRNDFRIQQDVPFKSDSRKEDKVSMGTQMFKLLFGDGMLNQDGFELDGQQMNGRELYDYYNNAFEGLINIKKQTLYKELGLDINGNTTDSQITVQRLQELLQKEAVKRGYLIQDIRGLELQELVDREGNPYYDFRVPLWLSVNSNRYESLLNSIISNRLMKYKLPGNAFVVGSESGLGFSEDLAGIDNSRIIFMDGWNGKELQGVQEVDGTFSKAQVFIPSKFKTPDGKLLDLFQKKEGEYLYLEKRENGTWRLKDGMIAPELLNNFSFRTPTSSHVSGSSIEITGILPPEVGDLMIVPKNFTKQKGLDYDIDKETAYQLNHVVDFKTGKIEVLSESHKEKAIKNIKRLIKEENTIGLGANQEGLEDFYKLMSVQLDDEFIEELRNNKANLQAQLEAISAKFDEKLFENKFIKAYLAVYNNPNPEVQKKINKVLSMDFAREQADMIDSLVKQGQNEAKLMEAVVNGMSVAEASKGANANSSFTILSDEYQKQKMGLGAAGKLGIGIYSNYVTFHGLAQQTQRPLQLIDPATKGPKLVQIGKQYSEGLIGKELTIDGSRSIAEAFAEKQNTATDNEKEQILGRVNVNGTTIGVDSLLTLLGFDRNENGHSISYLLLSQPIIKEYVENMNRGKGIIADYQTDLETKVIEELVVKYGGSKYSYKAGKGIIDNEDGNSVDELSTILKGDNLLNGIKFNGENVQVQIATLHKFLDLKIYAESLGKVQNVLNTNNLGKSIVESNMKFDDLKTFADNKLVANTADLIGNFIEIDPNTAKPEEYEIIGDYYVKPTTPQGQIVVNGVTLANRLWNQFFPYGDTYFETAVKEALMVANIDLNSPYKVVEARQDIIQEIKKYIYSRKGNGIFTESAHEERKRLFLDTKTHSSLAAYLNANQNLDILKDNRLISKLTYEINTNGQPSLIKFNNTISDNFDEKYLYNSLAEMMIEDRPLPEWNGEAMSTRKLAQELVTYSYVEGGVQEAIQFIKYIPIEYLSEVGVTKAGKFMPTNRLFQMMNSNRNAEVFKDILGIQNLTASNENETYTFVKQYIQHNPDKANQYDYKDKRITGRHFYEKTVTVYNKKTFQQEKKTIQRVKAFILNSEESPKFISIKSTGSTKQEKSDLFENRGANRYERISVLGEFGMNEYDFANKNAVTLLDTDVVASTPNVPNVLVAPTSSENTFNIVEGDNAITILDKIANSTNPKFNRLAEVAKVLLPMADPTTSVAVRETQSLVGGIGVSGLYRATDNLIILDPKHTFEYGDSNAANTFIHEVVHSITDKQLRKYYNPQGTIPNQGVPAWVTNLHLVYNAFKTSLDPVRLETVMDKFNKMQAGIPVNFTSEEIGLEYGAVNIFEFVTTALASREFQQRMSEIPYLKSGKTLWDRFKDVVTSILKSLNPDIVPGSIAEAAINETLNFIAAETEVNQNNATFAKPEITNDPDIQTGIQDDLFDFGDPDAQGNTPSDFSLLPTFNPFDC